MKFILFVILAQSLEFASFLEEEGDYYRAIYEYKKVYYSDSAQYNRDFIASKIAYLSLKISDYDEALRYAAKISNDSIRRINLGIIYGLSGDFSKAESLLSFNDTLLCWIYLRKGDVSKARDILPEIEVNLKSPFLSGLLSAIIPGFGKIYSGRIFDGFSSFLINFSSGFSFYRAYKDGRKIETYFYGALTVVFYTGNIYGSLIATQESNKFEIDRAVKAFESKYNLWGFWR